MSRKQWIAGATAALVLGVTAGTAVAGPTLDAIKQRGTLVCGVHTGLTGFSAPDKAGKYAGHDVDFCKALAAAILGGFGSFPGAIVGGVALGLLESLGAAYVSSVWKDTIAFLVLLLVLFVRPHGLFGKAVRP